MKKVSGYQIREMLRALILMQKIYDDRMTQSFYTYDAANSTIIDNAIREYTTNANKIDLFTSLRAWYNDTVVVTADLNLALALRQVERKSRILNVLQMSLPAKERTYGSSAITPQSMTEGVKVQNRNESFNDTIERIKVLQQEILKLKSQISLANNVELEVPKMYEEVIP